MLLGAVIITWPANWFYISEAYPLTTRLTATGLFQTGRFDTMRMTMRVGSILWDQTKWAWLALIHTYDRSGFYGSIAPVMGRYAGAPFLLGLGYSLLRLARFVAARIRRDDDAAQSFRDMPGALLPILWIAATIFAGSALLIDPPQFPRYVLMLPAGGLLVGLGVVETFDVLLPMARRVGQWAAVVVCLALMMADVTYYFDDYLLHPTYASNYNTLMGDAVARYLREETAANPHLTIYYLTSPRVFLDNSTLVNYFAPDIYDQDLLGTLSELPADFDSHADNLFILGVDRLHDLELLTTEAPGGTIEEHWGEDGELLFTSYRLLPVDEEVQSMEEEP
jgi:hypothetical protein